MKAKITITDDQGNVFEGEIDLAPMSVSGRRARKQPKKPRKTSAPAKLDFSLNERAFVMRHAQGLSGAKKFTLLLAFLAKGQTGNEVERKEIEKRWNKMTAANLLGMKFNGLYSNKAKDSGWVDTPRRGVYVLSNTWKEVLERNNE